MANEVNLGDIYPVSLQITPASPEAFEFMPGDGTISIDITQTSVEITNSRGGVIQPRTADGIYIDQSRLIVGYRWDTSTYSPQEHYQFHFRVGVLYVTDPSGPIISDFVIEKVVIKALSSINVFTSTT